MTDAGTQVDPQPITSDSSHPGATLAAEAPHGAVTAGEEQITPDPENFSMRHPLHNQWTLWFFNPKNKRVNSRNWEDNLKPVMTFGSVEEFWQLYNNIKKASELPHGSDYQLFKHGVKPKWEDPVNAKGGKWVLNVGKQRSKLDDIWMHTMMSLIGEAYVHPDEICGAVVSLRKTGDRVSLWTRTAMDEPVQTQVGRDFKQHVGIPATMLVAYQTHDDALRRSSSYANKNLYEV